MSAPSEDEAQTRDGDGAATPERPEPTSRDADDRSEAVTKRPPTATDPAADTAVDAAADAGAGAHANGGPNAEPAQGPIQARFAGSTAVGLVREHNEDNLVVADLSRDEALAEDEVTDAELGPAGLLLAVCDGMGGAAAGEVASQMAVEILFEAMRRGGPPQDRDDVAHRLVSAVEEAGRRIHEEAQQERSRRGMGTTATAAVLVDKVLFLAEVGDSRGYLYRDGELKQLTKDQSLVNQLIEAGHLTAEEADAFEHSNIILQALGTSASVQVDLTFVELRRDDRLLLCSDGLSGLVHDQTIAETLREHADPVECSAKLIELAEAGGGHDNITVVVADFFGEGLAEPKDGDAFGYMQYPLPPAEGELDPFADDAPQPSASPTVPSPRPRAAAAAPDAADQASMLWVLAGVAALLVGGAVIALSPDDAGSELAAAPGAQAVPDPGEEVSGDEAPSAAPGAPAEASQPVGTHAEPQATPEAPVAAQQVAADTMVDVMIHTDVEGARLLVNGEPKGDLQAGQGRSMRLPPGAYRFEAQTGGNPAAVEVVTVRDGVPLQVNLKLPVGADAVSERERAAEEARRAARRERREARRRARADRAKAASSRGSGSGSVSSKAGEQAPKNAPAPPSLPELAAPPAPPPPPPPDKPPSVLPDNPF